MAGSRVLLVEDDEITQYMMGEMLSAAGVLYEVANDGQECLDILNDRPDQFDAILLDIHMPKKSGLAAVSEIRTHSEDPPRGIYVVAVTADTAWHSVDRARKVGFDDVISKPVTMDKIKSKLQ